MEKAGFFYNEAKYELAIRAWEEMIKAYPSFSDGYLNMAYAMKELGQDTTKMLQQFKENLKTSTFYSEAEKAQLLIELGLEQW